MDREEFKLRTDEIKALIRAGRYPEAVDVADSIDWKRVRSVKTLCMVGDLYKITGRFQKSRNAMMLAYDRDPMNPEVVYSLCELAIKLGDIVVAIEYMKEYVRLVPGSTGRYVLQYKLYEAQGVSLEERAELLEELRTQDYKPRWVYELAALYRDMGDAVHCADICDDLFSRLGMQTDRTSHRYALKALQLKSEVVPLTGAQEAYVNSALAARQAAQPAQPVQEERPDRAPRALRKPEGPPAGRKRRAKDHTQQMPVQQMPADAMPMQPAPMQGMPMGDAPTISYDPQALMMPQEMIPQETMVYAPVGSMPVQAPLPEETRVFAPVQPEPVPAPASEPQSTHVFEPARVPAGAYKSVEVPVPDVVGKFSYLNLQQELASGVNRVLPKDGDGADASRSQSVLRRAPGRVAPRTEEDGRYDTVLSQEGDGQISLVLPEPPEIEEQITGQISIEDIINRIRTEQQEAQEARVKQIVQGRTEGMFNSFERSAKEGPQAEIDAMLGIDREAEQREKEAREKAAAEGRPEVKVNVVRPAVSGVVRPVRPKVVVPEVPVEEKEPFGDTTEFPAATNALEAIMMRKHREEQEKEEQARAGQENAEAEKTEAAEEEKTEEEKAEQEKAEEEKAAPVKETQVPAYLQKTAEDEEEDEDAADDAGEIIEEEEPEEETSAEEEKAEEEKPAEEEKTEAEDKPADEEKAEEEKPADEEKTEEEKPAEAEQEEEKAEEDKPAEVDKTEDKPAEEEKPAEDKTEDKPAEEKQEEEKTEEKLAEEKAEDKPAGEEKADDKPADDKPKGPLSDEQVAERIVALSDTEKSLYGHVLHHREACKQIVAVTDHLAERKKEGAYVTGKDADTILNIAKGLIRSATKDYQTFSGKVAKIKGESLSAAKMPEFFSQLRNGAMIVTGAARMEPEAQTALVKAMEENARFTMVVLTDTDKNMRDLLNRDASFAAMFPLQVDVENISDDSLIAYGREYAREKEFSIDNMGILALHTRIETLQTYDHKVTRDEVREIVDEAIARASKRNFSHFVDVLTHKRYDEEDMIILREKDFLEI